jgi:hypothetical protein
MRRAALALLPISLAFAGSAFALPPGDDPRGFRDGANHHLGDDSFTQAEGRAPTSHDGEAERMHIHLQYVRALLADQPATQPALAARRAELLGYLDDYIAKGITPLNDALPWRSPVFIDANGSICAVGYLIERSAGRALAEQIARAHRYDFLEDIAAAMPEVEAWIAGSGFTLTELASIQPGYMQPQVEDWLRWNVAALSPPNGKYHDRVTTGAWRHRRMEGEWIRTAGKAVVGRGTLHHGDGTWTSFYPSGAKMAEGPMVHNDPHGRWTLFHPSGNIAAEGRFVHGLRNGDWRFYYDTKDKTPIAVGPFAQGHLYGDWHHYDAAGKLLAVSTTGADRGKYDFGSYLLSVVPGRDGVAHDIHQFGGPDRERLDSFELHGDRVFVHQASGGGSAIYDAAGNELLTDGGGWFAGSCHWNAKQRRLARHGELDLLHTQLLDGLAPSGSPRGIDHCDEPHPLSIARGAAITRLLAQRTLVRAATPKFIRQLALGDEADEAPAATPASSSSGATPATAASSGATPATATASAVTPATATASGATPSTATSDATPSTAAAPSATIADTATTAPADESSDLPSLLAANMVWYVEWPHVDQRFIRLFKTIPGYWLGFPNGDKRPEADRAKLIDIAPPLDE